MPEFERTNQEAYGKSSVRLERLDMANQFNTIVINEKNITLPTLNLKKYYAGAEAYALIETLHDYPMTMVDVLYTPKDILGEFENDKMFREDFLHVFSRVNNNVSNRIAPALTLLPKTYHIAKAFSDALKSALSDAVKNQILIFSKTTEEDIEERLDGNEKNQKEDGIVLEFLKTFYDAISGNIGKSPLPPERKTYILTKMAILMKSGAMIIGSEEIAKYFSTFQMAVDSQEQKSIRDSIAIHFSGINEELLMSSPTYCKKFGDILLSSNILEVFSYYNIGKPPKMRYGGQYNEELKRIEVNRETEGYFDRINELMDTMRDKDEEGR